MRSTPPNKQTVRTTLPTQRQRMISGVCSECGTTYQVEANDGNEKWACPRCGPSTPIDGDDEPPKARRRRRYRGPRIRVPFFLTQLMIVCLTFALFMVFVINYMDSGYATRRKPASSPPVAKAATDANPAVAGSDPSVPAGSEAEPIATADATTPAPLVANEASGEPTDSPPTEPAPNPPVADVPAVDVVDASIAAVPSPQKADSLTTLASRDIELPIGLESGATTVRRVMDKSLHFFGRQVEMQCRLVGVYDDAHGKVPHRFDIDGQSITLSEADDANFLRLEIVDVDGEPMDSLFVERHGDMSRRLDWLMTGDWMVISATPGVRYETPTSSAAWGLMLTNIAALTEHTHFSDGSEPKKLAERQ